MDHPAPLMQENHQDKPLLSKIAETVLMVG
jgi:hypothetical protein